MSLSPERKGRLTASKFASAMGISKYKSIHQLYKDEIGEGKPLNRTVMNLTNLISVCLLILLAMHNSL